MGPHCERLGLDPLPERVNKRHGIGRSVIPAIERSGQGYGVDWRLGDVSERHRQLLSRGRSNAHAGAHEQQKTTYEDPSKQTYAPV